MKNKLATGMGLASVCAWIYVAAYFGLGRPGVTISMGGRWAARPDYIGLPDSAEIFFRPLHDWDRTFLRPGLWQGRVSLDEQSMAAEVALERAMAAVKRQ
jgi:hypothetical protein